MRFTDFLIFDSAARELYNDPNGQRRFRACMTRLSETAMRYPGTFMAEAAAVRKGVAFRQKSLDDTEHAVFADRLADRLGTKPAGKDYGTFLRHSVRSQGDVLASRLLCNSASVSVAELFERRLSMTSLVSG